MGLIAIDETDEDVPAPRPTRRSNNPFELDEPGDVSTKRDVKPPSAQPGSPPREGSSTEGGPAGNNPAIGTSRRIEPKDSDRVLVDVVAYNSKVYYIQGEVYAPGRLPVTGQERVLDAINFANGLTQDADHDHVFVYRQPPEGGPVQTLKVDIDQLTLGDDLSTNYQLRAGDRLVVRRRGEVGPERPVPAGHPSRPLPDRATPRPSDASASPTTPEAAGRNS